MNSIPAIPAGYKTYWPIGESVKGISWGEYTFWPFDDVGNYHELIIVAYDSYGIEKKRISIPGYRYVSKIEIDNDNETIKFTTQSNSFTLNWSDLVIE